MASSGPQAIGHLAAFNARGEVTGLWTVGPETAEIVFRDGWLVPRPPGQILPRDAPVARIETRPGPHGRGVELRIEGANLMLSGLRLRPGRPKTLDDGDTLVLDPRDIGEPPAAVFGGLLVRLPEPPRRAMRALAEVRANAIDAPAPGAGRGFLHGGLAAAALGALPCAGAALSRPEGSASREALIFAALGLAVGGAVSIGLSRVMALAGTHLEWDAGGLTRTVMGGLRNRPERWPAADVDGFSVRLEPSGGTRWTLLPLVRIRGQEHALERGRHLAIPFDARLTEIAAVEARRNDWLETAARVARTFGRPPDVFVTNTTDAAWPPDRARAAVTSGRFTLP